MSGSVGTMRAGSNKHTGPKEKMTKNDRNTQQQQQTGGKSEVQSSKIQPTQEQLRLAHDLMSSSQTDADPKTVKELMVMTGKSEDVVVIALHDAQNDANTAVMMLLDGGDDQGEWREQSGKKKKKSNTTSQKDGSNHIGDDQFEGRKNDRGDREEKDRDAGDRSEGPPHRGRRNGGPPPRLSRGRGRDRGNFGDRDNRDRNNTEEWDNDDRRERSGSDRGRARGRGGFGGRRTGGGGGGGRGRFNSSGDRDNRSFNRVPRFEKLNNSQPIDGPEIDTWTNETAETTNNKDTDWDNWSEAWGASEEDQWTGTLNETKVFTPSQMKIPEPEPVLSEPPSSLGQRLDVDSLFSESAKFSKAPDYSKPTGDAYINQFNQAATESIKNTIGIGSSPRSPQSLSSMAMPQSAAATNSLGLSSLATGSGQPGSSVLSSLTQGQQQSNTMGSPLSQLQMGSIGSSHQAQMSSISSQPSQMTALNSQLQAGREQASQSRIPSVVQQQNLGVSQNNSLQQRPKPQRSKLPPPSKIPSTAVEMPGHIPQNPQLDLQFGIDFGTEPTASFGFGSGDNTVVTSSYSSANGSSAVISNHLPPSAHVSKASTEGSSVVSNIMTSPSAGSSKVPSNLESQPPRQSAVFHNSVYNSSPPKNESQSMERDQNMSGADTIPFPSAQMERKSSPLMPSQRSGQNQNLSSGSMASNKSDTSSNNIGTNYPATNGYGSSSYQSHQKGTSISQSQFTHTTSSQGSSYPGQYPPSQSTYPSSGPGQFAGSSSTNQYPPGGQPPQFNNAQGQYSSQNQFSGNSGTSMGLANHQSQYSSGSQNYSSGGQSQYPSYQSNTSSFPSHPQSQSNFPSTGQSGGPSSSLYPVSTPSSVSSYTSQSSTYQSPSAGSSYHSRDNQTSTAVSTQSSGVSFPSTGQSSLKSGNSQTGSNFNSQSYNSTPQPLQPSSLANKLGETLSKMTLKDNATLEGHQPSQFEHSSTPTTTVSASLSLTSAATTASLSTGTSTISSTSTATSITSTSRIASMPLTSKAPPNLPPGVPLMGQYIMGQSTMPPFYSVQPPLYGYDDVQLLAQQRMPLQAGSYYDMGAFPAPAGSTLPAGRDQQPPIPNVPFSGTSADSSKMPRVDAQSPNSAAQPQNAHSTAQPSLINFHYGYYYPSMFPGAAAGLQYPMFPIPPVTNAAAHAGTTATTQFQKTYPSHVYTTKGYDELNQAQDFSKTGYGSSPSAGKTSGTRTGTSDIAPNAYNKSHNQAFEKPGFHGGTPPPFNLPMATATQAGPMGAPTAPFGTPFLPMMAPHQPHNQMMHHQIPQDSNSSASRGMSQASSQSKSGGSKSYGGPPYWNN